MYGFNAMAKDTSYKKGVVETPELMHCLVITVQDGSNAA